MDEEMLELKKKIRSMLRLDFILPEDLPEISLYMDQVTHFMDQHLEHNKRNPEDKVLTKTMINNYTRNRLVPPPDGKKYNREHITQLIYIYYLKNVLSIGDIQKLMTPLQDHYPSEEKMTEIYQSIYELERPWYFSIEAETLKAAALVDKKLPKEEDPYLNKMAFIYLLAYDMFSKKRLIEKMIDEMTAEKEKEEEHRREEKKREEKKRAGKKTEKRPGAGKKARGTLTEKQAAIRQAAARKKKRAAATKKQSPAGKNKR